MKLLPFNMPPFARVNWVSLDAKERWGPRLEAAKRAYYRLEIETVKHGLRKCTTTHVSPHNLDTFQRDLAKQGLLFLALRKVGQYTGFSHYHPPVQPGKPWNYYGVIARNLHDAQEWAESESYDKPTDHDRIGSLLGYPKCCRDFFNKEWASGYIDPIWQQALNTRQENVQVKSENKIKIKPISGLNSAMLRYIGIRIVPHLAHSLDCEESLKMAREWLDLGRHLKLDGIDDLVSLLEMPVSWSALKGIAIIRTPLFVITTNSVPCYPEYVVEKDGTFYPDEAPYGLRFPWRVRERVNKIQELRRLQAEGFIPVQ